MVVWITGPSAVGKTAVGERLWRLWKERAPNVVLVDGDAMRQIFGTGSDPAAFAPAGRRTNAERIVEICRWLDAQGIHVVCCILAIFDDILERNRGLFSAYLEVRLSAPQAVLAARDPKGLYRKALAGEMPNVVGIDIPYALRSRPDLSFDTAGSAGADEIARSIIEALDRS